MPTGEPVAIDVAGAGPGDINAVQVIDERVLGRADRREFLHRAVERGDCLVARWQGEIAGFAVVNRSFYDQRVIALLIVVSELQRRGIGSALMRAVEARYSGEKLFTSTNASNLRMQALCERLGYVRSGYIENLDESAPEIVYIKLADGDSVVDVDQSWG